MTMNAAYDVGMTDEELTEAISLRITKEDRAMLDALAAGLPLKALSIARIALRHGLKEFTRNPALVFRSGNVAAQLDEMTEEIARARAKKPAPKKPAKVKK